MSETNTANSGGGAQPSLKARCAAVLGRMFRTYWGRVGLCTLGYVAFLGLSLLLWGELPHPSGPAVSSAAWLLFASQTPQQMRGSHGYVTTAAVVLLALAWLFDSPDYALAGAGCALFALGWCAARYYMRRHWPAGAWMQFPDGVRHALRLHAEQCKHSGVLHWRAYAPGDTAILAPPGTVLGLDYEPRHKPPVVVDVIRDEDGRHWCQPRPAGWLG